MSYFTEPDLIPPNSRRIVQRLPKRPGSSLELQQHGQDEETSDAWGIYFKEGWDWPKIRWILAFSFFPPSLLFGVLWTVLKRDIQGAFGVAGWWMAGVTIVIGIVGSA